MDVRTCFLAQYSIIPPCDALPETWKIVEAKQIKNYDPGHLAYVILNSPLAILVQANGHLLGEFFNWRNHGNHGADVSNEASIKCNKSM